jgi:hypothetical protein
MNNTQISTATNISAPDLSNSPNNPQKYFNNIFAIDFSVGLSNDVLVSFFEEYTGNANGGKALASAVLYTAQAQGIDPLAMLDQFKKLSPLELNNYLAAFLNISRVPTSQIGIRPPSSNNTNPVIARIILP